MSHKLTSKLKACTPKSWYYSACQWVKSRRCC